MIVSGIRSVRANFQTAKRSDMAHILLPTDLGEQSMKAAVLAADLFGSAGNTYTLVHAFTAIGLADPMVPSMLPDIQKVHDEGLEAYEQRLRAKCDLSGAQVRRIVAFGPLSGTIDELAKEQDVDLVVMASSGRTGSSIFGSNTTGVIQGAQVPVLEIPVETRSLAFRRVLFADDRSSIERHSLDILASIARLSGAEVLIVHVATGRPASEQVDNSALFDQVFAGLRLRSIMVEHNDVEEALFDVAGREQVDLIALLHRHTGLWERLRHGSTTKAVALHSTIPVLALEQ